MDNKTQLELQAFLDGELSETKTRDLAALAAADRQAGNLLAELRNTRQTLTQFEPERKLPESREFYWSKIERAIKREHQTTEKAPSVSLFTLLRRFLVPAGAVAALAFCVTVAVVQSGLSGRPDTERTFSDSDTFTYHDDANGTTLVWLTYPAERELADNGAH